MPAWRISDVERDRNTLLNVANQMLNVANQMLNVVTTLCEVVLHTNSKRF